MLRFLTLKKYRGIDSISFDELGRVNLVIGGNNTGKTSILEALVLLLGDVRAIQNLPGLFRDDASGNDMWNSFWPLLAMHASFDGFLLETDDVALTAKEHDSKITLERFDGRTKATMVRWQQPQHGEFHKASTQLNLSILSTTQPNPVTTSNLFNEIAPLNPENETKLQDLLRESIEPRLRRLRYAKPKGSNQHLVYADLGSGPMIPFTQMGRPFPGPCTSTAKFSHSAPMSS